MTNTAALQFARWDVRWLHNGRVVVKDCGEDLSEAKRIYSLAVKAGKKSATLRCKNVAFPPPDKYYRRPMIRKEKVGRKIIRHKVYVSIMDKLNRKGIWWCPYCVEMRHFVKRKGFTVDGIFVPEDHYACPLCGIRHSNSQVARYNPLSHRIQYSRSRSSKSNRRRQRQRRS